MMIPSTNRVKKNETPNATSSTSHNARPKRGTVSSLSDMFNAKPGCGSCGKKR